MKLTRADVRNQQLINATGSYPTLASLAERFDLSVDYVCQIIATTPRLSGPWYQPRHRRLGRPFDMGGPRGVWIDYDLTE